MTTDTFTRPATALEAFLILTVGFTTDESRTAYRDLVTQIMDGTGDDDIANRANELLEASFDDGHKVVDFCDFLHNVPFDQVAEYGAGNESVYEDGLVSLWVQHNTDGYGRDRPSADQGFYLEVKLHMPWKLTSKIESALEPFGIDADDVYHAVASDGYLESDTLDWTLERDWQGELEYYGYPALAVAEKDGRLTRAYKGIHLHNYVTIAEAVEVAHFVSSGRAKELAENLAVDWHTQTLAVAIQVAFDLESPVEFAFDASGNVTLWVDDDDKAILAKVADEAAKGKKLKRVTTTTFEMV